MGTMLITIICLLRLFSQLQPARGETTELLESVGKRTPRGSYDEIVCSFNVEVSLSRVDFVNNTGSEVFAIVDCGTSCNVRSSYQDVLHIVSPENTISGDYFVFSATHSEKTTGSYTCHGIPITQVAFPPPSGTGDDDGDGDGEESHKTSALPPETDEASHNAGGSSNGLLALLIIPILVVLIVVVLLLHWRGVIQIPCLWKTGGGQEEPRDLRSILGNLLQPFTRCWESTHEDNEEPVKHRESNYDQDEEAPLEVKALLGQNEDKPPVHLGAAQGKSDLPYSVEVSVDIEGKDDEMSVVKEPQPLLRESYNNTQPTQDENAEECHTLPQSTLSPNSTEAKNENGDVEERQTSLQSSLLSNGIKITDVKPVAPYLSAASLSGGSIQHKVELPKALKHKGTYQPLISPSFSVIDHNESKNDDKIGPSSTTSTPNPRNAESRSNDVSTSFRELCNFWEPTPQTSSTTVEGKREESKSIKGQLMTARNKEGMEKTEERRRDGKITIDENKEDMDGRKEREDEKANVEMEEKEIMEIKLGTEDKEDTTLKEKRIEESMAAKAEQEDKEEAKREVEHAQELEARQ